MTPTGRLTLFRRAIGYWNWKCALLSASARSLVYLATMVRSGSHGGLAVVLVEMVYVTITAGLYAGLQQKALSFRSRFFGNLTVVLFVPGLSQALDCFAHRAMHANAPGRATVAVCIFTALSALFRLYVMRRGAFIAGQGRSLAGDFRRMPRLIAGFVLQPFTILSSAVARTARAAGSEAIL